MSATVTNWEQFKSYINAILKECLKEIAEETKIELEKYVLNNWYGAYMPSIYDRTYELLDSITRSEVLPKSNGFDVSIFFDTDKIVPFYTGTGLNQHMGFDGVTPFTDGLIEVIEEGNPNAIPSSQSHISGGIHMFRETADWLKYEIPKIAKKVFGKYGLKLTIT